MRNSCEKLHFKDTDSTTNCPCDQRIHPPILNIPAGLPRIPRQIAGFPDFRDAMLTASRSKPSLRHWRAQKRNDFGMMLIEMGAYVFDILSFYDEAIANECYLRCAHLRPSVRKIVSVIGYRPQPAVGAQATLAAFADGMKQLTIPTGTAFRSGAFDDEPPQVFELSSDVSIHPFTNTWTVQRSRRDLLWEEDQSDDELYDLPHLVPTQKRLERANVSLAHLKEKLGKTGRFRQVQQAISVTGRVGACYVQTDQPLLATAQMRLERGNVVLAYVEGKLFKTGQVRQVQQVGSVTGRDGERYVQITLDAPIELAGNTEISQIRLETPTGKCRVWTNLIEYSENLRTLALDGVYKQVIVGDKVVLRKGKEYRWFLVKETNKTKSHFLEEVEVEKTKFAVPSVIGPATEITLDSSINCEERSNMSNAFNSWAEKDLQEVEVLFDFIEAGVLTVEQKAYLSNTSSIKLAGPLESPGVKSLRSELVLYDANESGVKVSGNVDFDKEKIALDPNEDWHQDLKYPVQVFGNIFKITRGESVVGEILGSGDALIPNQSFKLAKKPLTYLAKPTAKNDTGVENTLKIYVDGIQWEEVQNFFEASIEDRVFIVRQDDEGESHIIFGDGIHGVRLSTGRDNVVANYRFGAGGAAPPVGSITQIARPAKGLTSVHNPLAAGGGDDAESANSMQKFAPQSALLLGRAVSIMDIETATAQYPGVRAAKTLWRWEGNRQRPMIEVWYIADANLSDGIRDRLQALTDPSTPIAVRQADGITSRLTLTVMFDKRYLSEDVEADVWLKLLQPKKGFLVPEKLGIGKPLYRSYIFDAVLYVPGVISVRSLLLDGEPFGAMEKTPEPNRYFNFEAGSIKIFCQGQA